LITTTSGVRSGAGSGAGFSATGFQLGETLVAPMLTGAPDVSLTVGAIGTTTIDTGEVAYSNTLGGLVCPKAAPVMPIALTGATTGFGGSATGTDADGAR
jgi:hypothetical protein